MIVTRSTKPVMTSRQNHGPSRGTRKTVTTTAPEASRSEAHVTGVNAEANPRELTSLMSMVKREMIHPSSAPARSAPAIFVPVSYTHLKLPTKRIV